MAQVYSKKLKRMISADDRQLDILLADEENYSKLPPADETSSDEDGDETETPKNTGKTSVKKKAKKVTDEE